MKSKFTVQDTQYEVVLEKKERGEGDKFNPYGATVSGQPSGNVSGTCRITDDALRLAEERTRSEGASSGELLARACGKSLASELVIRKLEPDFSFVVDHRWLD
ncbi:MAG: hypothetical protein E2P02_00955 [Acidobacteria bacterium]|nr:MAG: hypothetical protein E2P02_00955 [Acidobacteriota bacterium]